jgi:DNA-binding CsgD family transcriptional regulator
MENNDAALKIWLEIISHENLYFRTTAKYLLLQQGIIRPNENQIQEKLKYLLYSFFSFLDRLSQSLFDRELEGFIQMLGEQSVIRTANRLNISTFSVKVLHNSIFEKCDSKNIAEVAYHTMRFGLFSLNKEIA